MSDIDIRRQVYKQYLPTFCQISLGDILGYCSSIIAIVGLLGSLICFTQEFQSKLYAIFLIILVILLFLYNLRNIISKRHRYAQAVYYIHYINHLFRDTFAEIGMKRNVDLLKISTEMLDAIADCFSIITGQHCRACVKEIVRDELIPENPIIDTKARDIRSMKALTPWRKIQCRLNDNTDFYSLWYALQGYHRFYFSNNLQAEFVNGKYKNSSFEQYGEPEVKTFLNFSWVLKWPLPYKSTIVFPIRYLEEFTLSEQKSKRIPPKGDYWGFLCIDCCSKNVFDSRFAPELGGAFADLLYVLFRQIALCSA